MADEPLDENTARELVEFRDRELQLKYRELEVLSDRIQMGTKNLENQKEIAIHAGNAYATDREQERQAFGKESIRQKRLIFLLVFLFVIFASFLVIFGHTELLKDLLTFGIAFVGGFGYSHYLRRNAD